MTHAAEKHVTNKILPPTLRSEKKNILHCIGIENVEIISHEPSLPARASRLRSIGPYAN
jgi:hypothetical protein